MRRTGNQTDREVGQRFKFLRDRAQLSHGDLAPLLGVSTNHLVEIETGTLRASPTLLLDAARTFEVNVGAFFDDALMNGAGTEIQNRHQDPAKG